mmetsp:Transcript_19848/g.33880  ORF Transcript_19848/g.33880 Transcript_19848/m.33880 type:complete len:137 (+) Transcript_19848:883-1293(+)
MASGSRDGTVKIWKLHDEATALNEMFCFDVSSKIGDKPHAVTAVAFASDPLPDEHALLAAGLESGLIEFWSIQLSPPGASFIARITAHSGTVTKLAWRPGLGAGRSSQTLASVGMDNGCRLYSIGDERLSQASSPS